MSCERVYLLLMSMINNKNSEEECSYCGGDGLIEIMGDGDNFRMRCNWNKALSGM